MLEDDAPHLLATFEGSVRAPAQVLPFGRIGCQVLRSTAHQQHVLFDRANRAPERILAALLHVCEKTLDGIGVTVWQRKRTPPSSTGFIWEARHGIRDRPYIDGSPSFKRRLHGLSSFAMSTSILIRSGTSMTPLSCTGSAVSCTRSDGIAARARSGHFDRVQRTCGIEETSHPRGPARRAVPPSFLIAARRPFHRRARRQNETDDAGP